MATTNGPSDAAPATGSGLADGRFSLASEPGVGTTVTISLPPERVAA